MALHPYLSANGPLAIAHRGGALEGAENSREAFAHAASLGYRYLETDVHLTADDVVVVFHDSHLDRVSSASGAIRSWTWADLQTVELIGGGSMLTLDEMLTEFPECKINIDAKSDEVVHPLLDVLDDHDAYERVCIGSFSDQRLADITKRKGDHACISIGPRGMLRFMLKSRGLPIEVPPVNALQLPPKLYGVPVITRRLVDSAHEMGLMVHAWTIDDEQEMDDLLDLGVDGIMTDSPTLLRSVFERRGLWE